MLGSPLRTGTERILELTLTDSDLKSFGTRNLYPEGAWNMHEDSETKKPIFVPPLVCVQDSGQRQVWMLEYQ